MPYIPARSAFSVAGQHLMGLGNMIAQQAAADAARKQEEERYADAIRREQEGRVTDLALRGFVADTPDSAQGVMQRGAASGTPIAAVPGMPAVGVGLGALIGGLGARERFQAGPSVKIGDATLRYDRNADLSALEGDRQFNRQQGAQIGAERRDDARDAARFTRDAAHQERMARLQAALSRVGRGESQPNYQLQEVEGGFARFNPRTGQLEPIGQAAPTEGSAPGSTRAALLASFGAGSHGAPPATEHAGGGLRPRADGAGRAVSQTDGMRNTAGFYLRARGSGDVLDRFGAPPVSEGAGKIPVIGNFFRTDDQQVFRQAVEDFVGAVLRKESGATISDDEFDRAERTYIPVPGDSPAVLRSKAITRQRLLQGMRMGAGPLADEADRIIGAGTVGAHLPGNPYAR